MDLNLSLSKIHDKIQMGKVFFHLSTKHKVQEKNAVTV